MKRKMKRGPWSSDEIDTLRRLAKAHATDEEIGRRLGRAGKSVGQKRRDLRIKAGFSLSLRRVLAKINLKRIRAFHPD